MTYRILAAVIVLGTNMVLAQQEIRITVPNDFEAVEGDVAGNPDFMDTPFRFQDLYPASEFSLLPDTHRNIVGLFLRPDASVTESRTVTYGNVQLRMSTTLNSELDTVFDNNLSDDATVVYEGPLTVSTQASGPPEGPRGFEYRYDFEAPFFYDPSAGNLVFDVITSSGYTPSQREDEHSGAVSMFGGPDDTEGGPLAFGLVVQFSFVPARVIPGDFNEDGVLDLTDFGILAANFNKSFDITESFSRGDINLDRRVDLRDFLDFRQVFNDRAVAAVPEPSSVMLGFMLLGAMVVCVKRNIVQLFVA